MSTTLAELADRLERDRSTLERELAEIEMLLRQATVETERHEARRVQLEERVTALERDAVEQSELAEARTQLLSQTRRQTMMQAQLEVLSGKQRALQRFQERVVEALAVVRESSSAPSSPAGFASPVDGDAPSSPEVMAAQEKMRRDIARQMHDGPAQSIANIALQAQVVQHLFEHDPKLAAAELDGLVRMVEHALEATKDFIFDVRPMVLDDLGLVPTLRRSTAEHSRRSGVAVRFESAGADRRLPPDVEINLFRIVDDAVAAYLPGRPSEVLVELDWSEQGVRAIVQGRLPDGANSADRARQVVAAARRDKVLPAALASMIREQEQDDATRLAGLPEAAWADIARRAAAAGLKASLSPDRATLEILAGSR